MRYDTACTGYNRCRCYSCIVSRWRFSRRKGGGRGEEARGQLRLARSLLGTEQAGLLTLFGGGFSRNALVGICDAELRACGDVR